MRQRLLAGWRERPGDGERDRVPRLVVEADDPGFALADFDAFRAAGFEVAHCSGPGRHLEDCPAYRGELCSLLLGADVVLQRLERGAGREELASAIRRRHPELSYVAIGGAGAGPRDARPASSAGAGATAPAVGSRPAPGASPALTSLAHSASVAAQVRALRRSLADRSVRPA